MTLRHAVKREATNFWPAGAPEGTAPWHLAIATWAPLVAFRVVSKPTDEPPEGSAPPQPAPTPAGAPAPPPRRAPPSSPDLHAMRRHTGARMNVSKRVMVRVGEADVEAWALNVSRGGVRLLLDDPLTVGESILVELPPDASVAETGRRPARVVWVNLGPDGVIAGVEFTDPAGRAAGADGGAKSDPALRVAPIDDGEGHGR